MPTWDEAAGWYVGLVRGGAAGNDVAADVTLDLLGDVAGRHVLDVGCGEGHVARRLARAGAVVTGVEPTAALLAAARDAERRDPLGIGYVAGRAEDLGDVGTGTVDAAVAVLVLHHVERLADALAELRRVLRPDGVLVAVLPHPWTDHPDAGWTGTPDAPRRVLGDYRREGPWSSGAGTGATGTTAGPTSVRDIGWHHRTLATWLTALAAGFRLEAAVEPVTDGPWADTPRLLALRARTG
jgi:SAM-dependent methyltransferase